MGDLNYIECHNDLCKYWSNGKCRFYKTGYCVEIILDNNDNPICKSFKKEH